MGATLDSGFSARKIGFFGLPGSHVIEDAPTASAALIQAGLDWEVDLKPMGYQNDAGQWVDVPDRFLTVRSDTGHAFAPVGKQYKVLQNAEAFEFADGLLGFGAQFEAAGSWNGGANVFLTAKLPEGIKVAGEDDLNLYLLFRNTHDGSGAVSGMITPVRLACTNMLPLATRSAVSSWKCRHTATVTDRLQQAADTLRIVETYKEEYEAITKQLQETAMSVEEFDGFVKELTASDRLQEGMRTNWVTSETHARSNRWDALNSVTEFVEHERGGRGNAESRFESNLWGQGAVLRNRAAQLLVRR